MGVFVTVAVGVKVFVRVGGRGVRVGAGVLVGASLETTHPFDNVTLNPNEAADTSPGQVESAFKNANSKTGEVPELNKALPDQLEGELVSIVESRMVPLKMILERF